MSTRFLHDYQSMALTRVESARELLAEACGLLRACDRSLEKDDQGLRRPIEQSDSIEKIESALADLVVIIHRNPAGGIVG